MMESIRIVVEHGKQNAVDSVGKRLISHRNVLTSFLESASKVVLDNIEPENFLLDVLNKLFVQQSIDLELECECGRGNRCECRWNVTPATENDATEDNITVSPSLHVKMTLDNNPKLAYLKDKDSRLPLHYAAARGVYETVAHVLEANPQAAIIQDPVTGLYPMLAGSNGNTAAAFDLLLSEPNLVLGGILADQNDADEENVRKRKRSPSM
jgi:ankyrin repeat protein